MGRSQGRGGSRTGAAWGLAVEFATGAVIGLVDAQVWNRDKGALSPRHSRATADKESQRWLDNAAQAGETLTAANSITVVSDQESDIYEHFASRPSAMSIFWFGLITTAKSRPIPTAIRLSCWVHR